MRFFSDEDYYSNQCIQDILALDLNDISCVNRLTAQNLMCLSVFKYY